jgi:hypothetical protein
MNRQTDAKEESMFSSNLEIEKTDIYKDRASTKRKEKYTERNEGKTGERQGRDRGETE